eukprot:CAMPEP_0196186120 /NCGR_PEP_ID=MMETSP0911-20130528/37645_1 /TAXON_ID=49265 /ORGANISM="Thalassiosira rotula, Strain GSO102" /LENGTH=142 /DNA_ID=CAMNT_0041456821 /DNA_START=93 /DNA_END=521 /DNA_ORIENTATION=-
MVSKGTKLETITLLAAAPSFKATAELFSPANPGIPTGLRGSWSAPGGGEDEVWQVGGRWFYLRSNCWCGKVEAKIHSRTVTIPTPFHPWQRAHHPANLGEWLCCIQPPLNTIYDAEPAQSHHSGGRGTAHHPHADHDRMHHG